jgi:hypothetical protein
MEKLIVFNSLFTMYLTRISDDQRLQMVLLDSFWHTFIL